MFKSFFLPVGLLAGSIIGAGIFALPAVFGKAGISLGLLYLFLGGIAYTVVHLMYADVIMRTREEHRFPGYAKEYLGTVGFWLAIIIGIVEMVLVMTIYLVLSQSFGKLLSPHLGGALEVIIFWILGSAAVFISLKRMTVLEFFIALGILAVIAIIFLLGISNQENIGQILWAPQFKYIFLPLAPILFSLSGRVAIPSVVRYTRMGQRGRIDKKVRRAIIWGTLFPVFIYILFVIGVLGLSPIPSSDAVTGLVGAAPNQFLWVIGLLGLFILWSSYIIVGYDVNSILAHDFKLGRIVRFLVVIGAPIFLYFIGFQDFLELIGFVGGFLLALEGMLILLMWYRANRVLKSSSLLMRGIHPSIILIAFLIFALAFIHQIFARS